jgi:hypothetical protein
MVVLGGGAFSYQRGAPATPPSLHCTSCEKHERTADALEFVNLLSISEPMRSKGLAPFICVSVSLCLMLHGYLAHKTQPPALTVGQRVSR